MRSSIVLIGVITLVLAGLVACGPSEEEQNATATAVAAEIFATQTAGAPTLTSTPTATPRPTNTPTPTPTSTPTATPSPTPTPRPDLSGIGLTLDDLPVGYAPAPEVVRMFQPGAEGPFMIGSTIENAFWFGDEADEKFVFGFSASIDPDDAQAFDEQIDFLNQMVVAGMLAESTAEEPSPAVALDGIDGIGAIASGQTTTFVDEAGVEFRGDALTFRRETIVTVLSVGYPEAGRSPADIGDLARLIDGRILRAFGLEVPEALEEPVRVARCPNDEALCVGLVTDVGPLMDNSFNQATWEGILKAGAEFGLFIEALETKQAEEYAANIEKFASAGYDIIITVGFAMSEVTNQAALAYPDIHFIGVDQYQDSPLDNVTGLVFAEDEAGFMAGALAALLTESDIVAAVLGSEVVPPVVAFKEGFEAGVAYIDPAVAVTSAYHPGGLDVAFLDPEWGARTAAQEIDLGADVVFAAAGLTGNGALLTAVEEGVWCIGVDVDQWLTLPEARPCLVSSALKDVTPSVYEILWLASEGDFPAGNIVGYIGLAPFHDFEDVIAQEIKDQLAEIAAGLFSGAIKTGHSGSAAGAPELQRQAPAEP